MGIDFRFFRASDFAPGTAGFVSSYVSPRAYPQLVS